MKLGMGVREIGSYLRVHKGVVDYDKDVKLSKN